MNRKLGFTLIELLVTVAIMVILLTLTVVSLRSTQANARDEERKTDITSIAQQLESYYLSGNDDINLLENVYPSTSVMNSEATIKTTLRDLDPKVLRDPSTPVASPISLVVATDANTPTLASLNGGKTYMYQPINNTGTLCTTVSEECRKFNLYYTLETNPTILSVTSKHQ